MNAEKILSGLDLVQSALLVTLLLLAAWFDWRLRRLPVRALLGALAAGLLIQGVHGFLSHSGLAGVLQALAATGVALLLFGPLYLRGGLGKSDLWFVTALGAWTSWRFLGWATALGTLCLGAQAVLWLILRKKPESTGVQPRSEPSRKERREKVNTPGAEGTLLFVPALVLGAILALVEWLRRGHGLPWSS